MQARIPWYRRLFYVLIVLVAVYVPLEGFATWLWVRGTLEPESHWVYESNGTGWSYSFDPILGYALSTVPARMATTASNGTIECTGTIRGNNLGFPDAHDFTPDRADPSTRRVAVFGDSYTAGYYVPRSWPDLAEVAAPHIDFMNFAVDGGGLVNWWSVITRLVAPQEYELDAVIFAVFGDDLFREFSVYDDGYEAVDGRQVQFARVPLAPGRGLPASRSEARRHLQPVDRFHRVSPERFDALLRGEWRPRSTRSVRPFFAARALELLRSTGGPEAGVAAGRRFQAVHYEMMEEIRAALAPRGVPMLAVYVPWRDELTGGPARYGSADEVRRFAERIGADFLDGTGAFEDLDEDELESCWLKYDGHFSERGMQRFGSFVGSAVDAWLAAVDNK